MFLPISQNFSCKVSDFYNHPLSIKLVSILLRETFLPFSSLYREVFWNSKKWEDLSSLYCARSKGRRNLGEGLESAGIWVKQRKLLCYRFAVFTLFFTFTCVESWALVVIIKSSRNNSTDSYEKLGLLQSTSTCSFHLVQFVKCWQFFSGVEFQKTVSKFKKRKRKSCLVFMSSTKCEIRNFCVVVLQWRQRNNKKVDARPILLFCQSIVPIAFLPFLLTSP